MGSIVKHAGRFIFTILLFIGLQSCSETEARLSQQIAKPRELSVRERYLGQTPPGDTAQLFAPGLVSTGAVELNSVFSADGREFFFTRLIDGPDVAGGYPGKSRPILHHMVYANGGWSKPQALQLFKDAPSAWAADMAVAADGQRLYFMGAHPVDADGGRGDFNLWVSQRIDGAWSFAEPLPAPLNSKANEIYSSVVADGSLYFNSNRPGGLAQTGSDLYRAQRLADGRFAEPVNVGAPVNSQHGVGDTFVAADESYMILSSRRPGGLGGGDLFVSFRQADGAWSEPVNLGPEVNSTDSDYCPVVSPDRNYLFFSRRRSNPSDGGWPGVVEGDVYWVDAVVIERLRKK